MICELEQVARANLLRSAQTGNRNGAVQAASVLLEHGSELGSEWFAVSRQLIRWGELGRAIEALDLWKKQGADGHDAEYEKAVLFARMGRPDIALPTVSAIPDDKPNRFANAYLKASIATSLGDLERAEREFRRTIAALPASGRSWLGIAQLGRATTADDREMRRLAARGETLDPTDRASLENALGILAHGSSDHAGAFAHFERCTKILGRQFRYRAVDNEESAAIARKWDRDAIGRLAQSSPANARKPIFVTGLPRSGTTLVEQILSAHSRVNGGGELGLALQLEATANGFSPDDISRYIGNGGTHEELRALYLRLVDERIPGSGMFVDKSLNQSRSIGPFSVLFPDAPFVWLRRDPLDNAWSIYRSWLTDNVMGGWPLADIAHHMRIEERLLAHWQAVLGNRLLVLDYADLVSNPEKSIERLSHHCGLDLEPIQLTPHLSGGSVTTASAQQVRQPINKKGLGVAKSYMEWLAPFAEIYFANSAGRAMAGEEKDGSSAEDATARDETGFGSTAVARRGPAPFADATLISEEPRALLLLLKQALARGERAVINDLVAALIEISPEIGPQWRALATVLQHNGEHDLAVRAAAIWSRQQPSGPVEFERAAVLAKAGRLDDAWTVLETLPPDVPSALEQHYLKGTVLTNLGRLDEAAEDLRRAVGSQPRSGQAWLALAMTGRQGPDDLEQLEKVEPSIAGAPVLEQAAFWYAKARMLDQAGADAEAIFTATARGASLAASTQIYDGAADRREAVAARQGWSRDAIESVGRDLVPPDARRPIFVTGLPRSGTTLVEQILAAHTEIRGGEELGLFRLLRQDMGGASKAHFDAYVSRGGSAEALRDLYLHLLGQKYPGASRVVDKTLDASRNMGLIAGLFPDAPIVWLRRDPLDCAWSAYRTWFARGLSWSWSLDDIAAHFRIEDELFAHWTGLLGNRILTVPYAALVADPRQWIERISAHCGLESEPAQFESHNAERVVTTASVAQVREPINRKGLGSAGPFSEMLRPFALAYDKSAET